MSLSPLRVLLVEDNPSDARLVYHELRQGGFDPSVKQVENEADFLSALAADPEIILCDYSLPQFDALQALALIRARRPDIPFVIVSGSIGEETAVEAIKLGATDYLLKDRLGRLGPAVRQALEERKLREAERQSREALRESEESYRQLADSIPQIVWTARPDGAIDYVNRRAVEFGGVTPDEVTGWKWESFVALEDLPRTRAVWGEAIRTGMPSAFEFRLRRADGVYRWHISRQVAVRDQAGNVTRWYGTCTDIHDQKAAADQLARDALLLASVRDSVIVTDLSGIVTYWNEGATRLFGWTAEEMLGRPHADRYPETRKSWVAGQIHEPADGSEWLGEFEDYRKDGSTVWIDARVSRIADRDGKPVGFMGVSHDVTDRKRAEEALRTHHALLESQTEATPDGILVIGPDGRILSRNRRLLEMWGVPEQLAEPGADANSLVEEARRRAIDPAACSATFEAASLDSRVLTHDEVPLLDGRTLDRYSAPIRADGGESAGRVWFFRDITDQKRLAASLAAVMGSVADAIISVDDRGIIDSVNPAVERLFGYPEAELLGRELRLLMPEPQHTEAGSYFAEYLRTGEAKVVGHPREVLGRRKDGSVFPAELSVSEFRLHGARHFTGVVRDVTARKRLEEQFRQAQKMEAFGQLAGGVAHDFNNLLTIINGYSDLLLGQMGPNDRRTEPAAAIRDAGERAAALTAQLLAFSRKTIVEPKVLDLNEVVESMARMLRRLIGEDLRLSVVASPRLSRIKADLGQIEQVLMNLAVNARDAMPKGGRLTIETSDAIVEGREADESELPPGRYVRLVVTDTGHGIPEEIKAKIFEPFFTTKAVGKGTGLGLATVYGIVSQAGGRISVASEVGHGSTFSVLFPAVGPVPAAASTGSPSLSRGNETILLVEDEDGVRKLARIALETQGYRVLEAGGGGQALSIAEAQAGTIHLVVTDVVMPGMGGRDLVDTLRSRWPALRVLYISGYTDDAVLRYGVSGATDAFLQKPFTPLGLARKVRAVLDAPPIGTN